MNRFIKVSILFVYLLFAKVYPVAHCHTQEHHGEDSSQLSVHPTGFHLDDFDHHKDHDSADTHEHKNAHFNDDWNYIVQVKTFQSSIAVKAVKGIVTSVIEPHVLSRISKETPLKVHNSYLSQSSPKRAPPYTS